MIAARLYFYISRFCISHYETYIISIVPLLKIWINDLAYHGREDEFKCSACVRVCVRADDLVERKVTADQLIARCHSDRATRR